ncbi:MAG TPA: sigma-70 family RNA polymerase sigma factor, partial [Gammaproteobacteria bacterium]|nr:sigma-70 family RNA polymerase sigma factor [Gammaproteobacteria bacterium]
EGEAEFELFYREHFPWVIKYLVSLFGGPYFVDDATQEAMLIVWIKWEVIDDKKSYLFVTARHCLLALLLSSRRIVSLGILPDVADNGNLALEWIEANADLVRVLQELSWRQREAATLAWVCDFSEKEIARHMGISPGTVKSHLSRARESLKRFA